MQDFDSEILWATICTSRDAPRHQSFLRVPQAKFLMTVSTSSGKARSEEDGEKSRVVGHPVPLSSMMYLKLSHCFHIFKVISAASNEAGGPSCCWAGAESCLFLDRSRELSEFAAHICKISRCSIFLMRAGIPKWSVGSLWAGGARLRLLKIRNPHAKERWP